MIHALVLIVSSDNHLNNLSNIVIHFYRYNLYKNAEGFIICTFETLFGSFPEAMKIYLNKLK